MPWWGNRGQNPELERLAAVRESAEKATSAIAQLEGQIIARRGAVAGMPREQDKVTPLPGELALAVGELRAVLEPCGDVVFRQFTLGTEPPAEAALVYCKAVVDSKSLSEQLVLALMHHMVESVRARGSAALPADLPKQVEKLGLPQGEVRSTETLEMAVEEILTGYVAVLVDGSAP